MYARSADETDTDLGTLDLVFSLKIESVTAFVAPLMQAEVQESTFIIEEETIGAAAIKAAAREKRRKRMEEEEKKKSKCKRKYENSAELN